ncbi:MAG: branched-chain-amino-acid transaminase [Planctomycetes bacterium]|nr:branched-chain-amino-acid transaminase [Planctomycetota bacterium]
MWPAPAEIGDKPMIWVNGKMLPKCQAMVSVYDHGLLYGDGVFEGIRVYQGKIFKCQQHIDRLYNCAEQIALRIPITKEEMEAIQRECIEVNGIKDGYIRLVVTRGYGTLGLDPRRCPVPGIICIADQISLYKPEFYETGMKVILAKRPKMPIACLDPRIKSLNYLNNILAKVEAIEQGCDEAIMLNIEGYVTECTGDNLFIIKKGKVYTPPVDDGMLNGVTRRFVLETLCPQLGIEAVESSLRIEEVLKADEVFLTGTAAEVIAVNQIDETRIGKGDEGPVTRKIRKLFREIVSGPNIPEN